jgi:hypothetical protein
VLSWWWFADVLQGPFSNWCATPAPRSRSAAWLSPNYGVPVSRAVVRTLGRFPCLMAAAWLWLFEARKNSRVLLGVLLRFMLAGRCGSLGWLDGCTRMDQTTAALASLAAVERVAGHHAAHRAADRSSHVQGSLCSQG